MVLTGGRLRLDGEEIKCYTHRKKEAAHSKKRMAALLILCQGAGCILPSPAWQRAYWQDAKKRAREKRAERRAIQAVTVLGDLREPPAASVTEKCPHRRLFRLSSVQRNHCRLSCVPLWRYGVPPLPGYGPL